MQTWNIDGRDMTLEQLRKYKKAQKENKCTGSGCKIDFNTDEVLVVPKDILGADTGTESDVKDSTDEVIEKKDGRTNKEELSPLKRFHQLKDRGYTKLPKTIRKEYQELKKQLNL